MSFPFKPRGGLLFVLVVSVCSQSGNVWALTGSGNESEGGQDTRAVNSVPVAGVRSAGSALEFDGTNDYVEFIPLWSAPRHW